eukprot:3218704-Pyramimonas_sp.AAC.1
MSWVAEPPWGPHGALTVHVGILRWLPRVPWGPSRAVLELSCAARRSIEAVLEPSWGASWTV